MADVLIHHCTLRVVRRRGWSWGANPKRLLDEVMRTFPALLEQRLSALLPEEEDRELAAPVRIRIPIRNGDFTGETSITARLAPSDESRPMTSLEHTVDSVLRAALGLNVEPPGETRRADRFGSAGPGLEAELAGRPLRKGSALQRLLLAWQEEGDLENRLQEFSAEEIETWYAAVWRGPKGPAAAAAEFVPALAEQIETIARSRRGFPDSSGRVARLRRRLIVAAETAAQLRIPLDHPLILQTLDRVLPLEESHTAGGPENPLDQHPARAAGSGAALAHRAGLQISSATEQGQAVDAVSPPSSLWEAEIACALPFLLLGPLSRLRYFDVLAAVLEAANLWDDAPLFAAALAYKVLDPPERGWRRSPNSRFAAAAFAGLRTPVAEESLVDFSRRIGPHVGPLDSVIIDAMIKGHAAGKPVLLLQGKSDGPGDFLLIDAQGCFPIAYADVIGSLLPILRKLGNPIILVSGADAKPPILGILDEAGLAFVTDVPPARNESWRRIQPGSPLRAWTNHPAPSSELLLGAAQDFAAASEEAAALREMLAIARPGVVRAASPGLDRSLTLAASVAAGMISWRLWQNRGRTTPQLALERFCDLGARVRFDPESVMVRLPLGRRHRELSESGLLAPVSRIPWMGDRRVEYGGG